MFVGHFAVALAAKKATPRLSLPLLFAAVSFLDILWPLFIVLGVEHARITPGFTAASPLDLYDFPISHSLVTSLLWSALWGVPLFLRQRMREGLVIAGCVFSHYVLDFVTHKPDLPLVPGGGARLGLGLWGHLWPAVVIEGALFVAGIVVYLRATRATGRAGTLGFALFMLVLGASWLSGVFGPPPPNIMVLAVSALVAIPVFLLWAWFVDRRRVPRTSAADRV